MVNDHTTVALTAIGKRAWKRAIAFHSDPVPRVQMVDRDRHPDPRTRGGIRKIPSRIVPCSTSCSTSFLPATSFLKLCSQHAYNFNLSILYFQSVLKVDGSFEGNEEETVVESC